MAERGIPENAAMLSIWIMGLVALIYFLEKFEMELKPLVLAFVLVSILEAMVQFFEWVFLKSWLLAKMLPWKLWLIAELAYRTKLFFDWSGDYIGLLRELKDWAAFRHEWHGRDAGKYPVFRTVSIIITLFIVGFVTLLVHGLLMQEWSTILGRLDLYESQFHSISTYVDDHLMDLAHMVPKAYRNDTRAALEKIEENIQGPQLMEKVKELAMHLVNGVLQSGSTIMMQMLFFLLYSTFMLCDPLHINFSTGEGEKDLILESSKSMPVLSQPALSQPVLSAPPMGLFSQVSTRTPLLRALTWNTGAETRRVGPEESPFEGPRLRRAGSLVEEVIEGFELTELQQYLYRIMWNYFLLSVVLNAIFAVAVLLLLWFLNVDLSAVFALACFFLNFIPELGPIISLLLPTPFILLTPTEHCHPTGDITCVSDLQHRLMRLLWVMFGIMMIKFLVSNLLYSFLMGRNKTLSGAIKDDVDEVRETHGVVVLFAVVFLGKIWGTVGMLISVPVLSMVRLSLNMAAPAPNTLTPPRTLA